VFKDLYPTSLNMRFSSFAFSSPQAFIRRAITGYYLPHKILRRKKCFAINFAFRSTLGIFFLFCCLATCHVYALTPSRAGIASANQYATQAGQAVLKKGGNAFDAAIAVASTLAVTEPYNSGLGGGGFWLIYNAKKNKYSFIDARETAPKQSTATMYQKNAKQAINGPLSAGIPGEVAGIVYLSKHFAKLSLAEDFQAAINYAKNGFNVTQMYQERATFRFPILRQYRVTKSIFLKDNQVPQLGAIIKQPQLAKTLEKIAKTNGKDFYHGETAKMLVQAVRAGGGIWQLADLRDYQVSIRKPLKARYKDNQIITAPPPSAGGVALLTVIHLLEDSNYFTLNDFLKIHYMVEFMRNIYFDRYKYLGDPDFVDMPIKQLTSQQHAAKIMTRISETQCTKSTSFSNKLPELKKGQHTTHYSIIDKNGNIVAATLSLNYPFGSGFVAGKTGILLNDQMDDFAVGINHQNVYGLLGGKNNLIEPGKKPLSSMTPTIVISPDKTYVMGTPGGSKIVTMMILATVAAFTGDSAEKIVGFPRYHMQFYPDVVQYEKSAFSNKQVKNLKSMGYHLSPVMNPYGNMQVVIWDRAKDKITAASDPRGEGKALVN